MDWSVTHLTNYDGGIWDVRTSHGEQFGVGIAPGMGPVRIYVQGRGLSGPVEAALRQIEVLEVGKKARLWLLHEDEPGSARGLNSRWTSWGEVVSIHRVRQTLETEDGLLWDRSDQAPLAWSDPTVAE